MTDPKVQNAKADSKDQAILQKLFESSPDAIVVTDKQGRIVRLNVQAERMFGYSRDELLGQPVEILVPSRFEAAHPVHRRQYHTEPRMRPMGAGLDLYAKRKDGSEFPVDILLSPLETEEGRFVLSVVRDITLRKRAEEELRDREEQLRNILDNSTAVIYLKDTSGRYIRINRQFETLFQVSKAQVIGKTDHDLFPKESADKLRVHDLKVLEAGMPGEFEEVVPQDDGLHTYIAIKFPLRNSAGEPYAVGGISTDITERKRAQETLLLEMTNVLVSKLDVRELLGAISASLRQVIPHDYASLALYDPETKGFQVRTLEAPYGKDPAQPESPLPVKGSPVGWAFIAREPLVLNRMEAGRFAPEVIQRLSAQGIRTACWLPLTTRDRGLGALMVARHSEAAFTPDEVSLLSQVAKQIAVALDNALTFRQIAELKDRLAEEKLYLEDEIKTEYNFGEIVGESPILKRILQQAETVAPTEATVLILGETGTGKELIARAIHDLSPRRERTFVKLNCAAIPTGLLESELFGHEKGAFTGSLAQKIGRLELAHRGTLFLDEVGDIPLELQPKLLRALQEKEFERLGSNKTIPVDARLIAATNQDLDRMVEERKFRSDLYYRLKVFPITLPPLRERVGDIPILARYFAQKHALRMNKRIDTIPPEVMEALSRWHWPGNVRELENFLERAVILTRGPALQAPLAELIPLTENESLGSPPPTLEAAEREHIIRILRETKGVISGPHGAAARLGLKRTTLNSKMRKLGISRRDI